MSDNRYREFTDPRQVLNAYASVRTTHGFNTTADAEKSMTDALARIAELSPRTVDAAGRERAREVTYDWWLNTTGMSRANADQLVDRIIDALGYTVAPQPKPERARDYFDTLVVPAPAESEDEDSLPLVTKHCPGCGYAHRVSPTAGRVFCSCGTEFEKQPDPEPTPAPVTPAVELDVTALERIRAVLNCHENTRAAMHKLPMFGDMPDITIPGDLPMRITMDDNGVSVLRIGGDQ